MGEGVEVVELREGGREEVVVAKIIWDGEGEGIGILGEEEVKIWIEAEVGEIIVEEDKQKSNYQTKNKNNNKRHSKYNKDNSHQNINYPTISLPPNHTDIDKQFMLPRIKIQPKNKTFNNSNKLV